MIMFELLSAVRDRPGATGAVTPPPRGARSRPTLWIVAKTVYQAFPGLLVRSFCPV
ncbi:hypothetical protein GCM10025866_21020 [Naasia aerilata]|uniref:Uncharacterized protein n=1 Tax=Naasia aerilata TaxID=1162966 RepID=A0ABM8GD39_9MICO|nr:hypothetical protein GCM10025866_21020 [Naasia aerilata]